MKRFCQAIASAKHGIEVNATTRSANDDGQSTKGSKFRYHIMSVLMFYARMSEIVVDDEKNLLVLTDFNISTGRVFKVLAKQDYTSIVAFLRITNTTNTIHIILHSLL